MHVTERLAQRLLPWLITIATFAAVSWSVSQPACADDALDSTAITELPEVTVTAEKREENLRGVPISVSVLTRDDMMQRQIVDMAGVAAVTPGVDFQNTGSTIAISIRGISSGIAGYSTTGIYIDDVPIHIRLDNGVIPGTNATPLVFDLDRVEVLRGPQGTLFGAGAEGGTIRFIQPEPSLSEHTSFARAGLATTDHGSPSYEIGAASGGPIIQDEVGFRVSAWHRRDGGYIDHESAIPGGATYKDSAYHDSDVIRAALTIAPVPSLKISPSIFYQHIYWNDVPTFDPGSKTYPDAMTANWSTLNPRFSNVDNGLLAFQGLLLQPSSDSLYLPSLKIDWELPYLSLISTTSYLHRSYDAQQDFTTVTPVAVGLPWPNSAEAAATSHTPATLNVFTQELRAVSTDTASRLQWIFGLFFSESRQLGYQQLETPYWPTQILQAFGKPIEEVLGQPLLPGNLALYEREPLSDKRLAAYGQVTWKLLEHFSLTAGARVAQETNDYSIYINGPANGPAATFFSGAETQTVVDPKYGINFQPNDDNLLYFSVARGNRLGGVTPPLFDVPACNEALAALGYPNGAPKTYRGDSLWNYEIGSKNRLFSGRLEIDSSIFYIKWTDIQQAIPIEACGGGFTSNLGQATSKGFDFQARALVTEALKLELAAGYTNARNETTIVSGGNNIVAAGQQINPYAAPWIIVPAAEYKFAIAAGHQGYLRMDYAYHSKNPGPYNPTTDIKSPTYNANFVPNPSYGQLNLRAGTTWRGWDASVYALNALNKHPLLYNQAFFPSTFYGTTFTLPPLTVGAAVTYHW